MLNKPNLTYSQIWNINFGFLGTQICFTLVMTNTSRILSALGADTNDLAFLWLAAPLAGLFLQPLIGHFSDKTWSKLGRRIPYILIGLVISTAMMFLMPNSHILSRIMPPVFAGVSILFLIQSAFNISMQPYRSLVGDMVNSKQSNLGYSVQTIVSNLGAIVGSCLPFLLAFIGFSNQAVGRSIAPSLTWAFYIGIGFLVVTNLWTCFTVKEYPPKLFEEYNKSETANKNTTSTTLTDNRKTIITILQLSIVQLFSWFAFYYIWVYATDGIAGTIWSTSDPLSEAYNDAGNWFGILTGVYSIIAAIFSVFLSKVTDRFGRKNFYAFSLVLGSIGMSSMFFIHNQYLILLPMIFIGIAWAMILTMPFSILANVVPSKKMGLYMGLLNVTIVIPQIAGGLLGNFIFTNIAGGRPFAMFLVSGVSLLIGAISVVFLRDPIKKQDIKKTNINNEFRPRTEKELEKWMKENCYNFNSYSINGNFIYEGFGIGIVENKFLWYYIERGRQETIKTFDSESDVVEYAYNQIKSDKWAKTHCIGFTPDQSKAEELCRILTEMRMEYFQDIIPYYGAEKPVYRVFVLGCDIKKTEYLRNRYYTKY